MIGFIGTGTISRAVVEGLQSLPDSPEVIVSPRSEAVSASLAAKYPRVRRAANNQEVADANVVFLGMRPAQFHEAMVGVDFRADQIVVSMVAGLNLVDIEARWPKPTVCRLFPTPGVAFHTGPITIFPRVDPVIDMFGPLGDLFVVNEENKLGFGGLNAFMSSYFELESALIGVATGSGLPAIDARRFVVSLLAMLAETARRTAPEGFDNLVAEHQTKGGLNERVRAALLSDGWFDRPRAALSATTALSYKRLG